MMLHGVDIVEISRILNAVESWGERFLRRIYTDREIEHCQGSVSSLAVRFAAKEAVMKALGTGNIGVSWHDIETLPNENDVPRLHLDGGAKAKAAEMGVEALIISLSHSGGYAIASVIGEIHESR